ncbi:MAG: S9 family peptidase [Myxococcota bacterium]
MTDAWDHSAGELAWSPDGKALYTRSDNLGSHSIYRIDVKTGAAELLVDKGTNGGVLVGKDVLVYQHDALNAPVDLWAVAPSGKGAHPITAVNAARLAAIDWRPYEQFSFVGAHGDTVYGYVVKPAGFDDGKKHPTVMLIHGGPQGSMGDHFHYRWNPMAYAGHGFAVVFIDFHGSTGYGQAFTDAIRGDWGGAPFEDLMKGMDAALAKYPFMDPDRTAAAGASYGGFMINWINGQTDRFKALVCHDGNLDERMAYYATEEIWFPEWDHMGAPYDNPDYVKHNPIDHVAKWKTPTLVVHGGNDFRVVATQGMSTFTALQRRGIPSRFLYFPDENHWVLKPQNSLRWHHEVMAWLDRWIGSTK